jgi:hypothetical protein
MTTCSITRTSSALLALWALILARPAFADEAAAAFAKGRELFEEKRYVGAAAAFEEAYRLKPHFMVQCSIARCYENLNRFVTAARHYKRCLKEGASKSDKRAKIEAALKAMEGQISRVLVQGKNTGGDVFVDGRKVGTTPAEVPVNPGTHVVEVRREGAKPASTTINTLGGEKLTLDLEPEEVAAKVEASPKPAEPPPPPPPPSRKRRSSIWFWTGVALTAVLTATVVGLGAQTLKDRSSYEDSPTKDGLDTFKSRRTATNVVLGLTAAAAAGTTVLFFYTDFGGKSEIQKETAWGVGLRGTF